MLGSQCFPFAGQDPDQHSKRKFKSKLVVGVLACAALGVPGAGWGQGYTITDLSDPSDNYRLAHGINAAGQIVGEFESTNLVSVGAFWYHDGTNTDIGVLPGFLDAYAHGINDSGEIAGYCDQFSGIERGFLYANGGMTKLETLATPPTLLGYSEAYAINRAGQVVGTATLTDTAINHAVLWSGSSKTDLGALGGATYNSSAFGLNNAGVIVGESEVTASIYAHAFSYSNNVMTDLGTLPGGFFSRANAVNASGVIVGESDTLVGAGTATHAFVCTNGPGSIQDLGTLGGSQSSAAAINSAGQIVGYAVDSNGVSRAFLYTNSKMVDLNSLIPPNSSWTNLEAATGINDTGQITGYGHLANGSFHSFLLTPAQPTPVPVTLSSLTLDAGGFSFSFGTQTGFTYAGQFRTPLTGSNLWATFTNLTGTGAGVRVTNNAPIDAERYYRVVAQ
jgi:probable HAF family extracellular repeat protein